VPALNELAVKNFDASHTFDDLVHFIHVYVIEPHPQSPDLSPYNGEVWEAEHSSLRQPLTYAARVANAQQTVTLLTGNQLLVVDDLTPGQNNNPAWCTYGTCPNCAFLIRQDGTIDTAQTWFDATDMEAAIHSLLD
jgi:hypothetical protein